MRKNQHIVVISGLVRDEEGLIVAYEVKDSEYSDSAYGRGQFYLLDPTVLRWIGMWQCETYMKRLADHNVLEGFSTFSVPNVVDPLTSEMLQEAEPAEQERLIGEWLFLEIQVVKPHLAEKITGMLLEMYNTELLVLLSDQWALMNKINQQKQSQHYPGSTKNPSS